MAAEDEDEVGPPPDGIVTGIPIGYQTRMFLERGAPMGQQRTEAVRAARNLLGAGVGVDETIGRILGALDGCTQDPTSLWTYAHVAHMVADLASKPAPPPQPFVKGEIIIDTGVGKVEAEPEAGDGTFRFAFPEQDVVIEVSQVVVSSRGTFGWVRVLLGGGDLSAVECELRTAQGVQSMWRYFEQWEQWGPKPWRQMLEVARKGVIEARKKGSGIVWMDELERVDRPMLRISPLIINGHLNVIFATGGSGKSLLMLLLTILTQEGRSHAGLTVVPGNVLYLDWEQGEDGTLETLEALAAGIGSGKRFAYLRCTSTLVEMAEEIGRLIIEHDVEVVMVDSLTFALGGDKNDAQTVTAGTNAMRLWREGTTVVALDHVAREEKGRKRMDPFGSIFVRNAARNLLKIEAWMDPDAHVLHQVIEQTKTNKGVLPAFGLKYTFQPESFDPTRILVEREDPPFDVASKVAEKTMAEKLEEAPKRQEVYLFLRQHSKQDWSKSMIAQSTGIADSTVKSSLNWLLAEGMIYERKGAGSVPNKYGAVGLVDTL